MGLIFVLVGDLGLLGQRSIVLLLTALFLRLLLFVRHSGAPLVYGFPDVLPGLPGSVTYETVRVRGTASEPTTASAPIAVKGMDQVRRLDTAS